MQRIKYIDKLINIERAMLITVLLTTLIDRVFVKYVRYIPISLQSSLIKSQRIYISFQRLFMRFIFTIVDESIKRVINVSLSTQRCTSLNRLSPSMIKTIPRILVHLYLFSTIYHSKLPWKKSRDLATKRIHFCHWNNE